MIRLRFEFRHRAIEYRDEHGLAGTHIVVWTGKGWRLVAIDSIYIPDEQFH